MSSEKKSLVEDEDKHGQMPEVPPPPLPQQKEETPDNAMSTNLWQTIGGYLVNLASREHCSKRSPRTQTAAAILILNTKLPEEDPADQPDILPATGSCVKFPYAITSLNRPPPCRMTKQKVGKKSHWFAELVI